MSKLGYSQVKKLLIKRGSSKDLDDFLYFYLCLNAFKGIFC